LQRMLPGIQWEAAQRLGAVRFMAVGESRSNHELPFAEIFLQFIYDSELRIHRSSRLKVFCWAAPSSMSVRAVSTVSFNARSAILSDIEAHCSRA
jgi:hypothetical protein